MKNLKILVLLALLGAIPLQAGSFSFANLVPVSALQLPQPSLWQKIGYKLQGLKHSWDQLPVHSRSTIKSGAIGAGIVGLIGYALWTKANAQGQAVAQPLEIPVAGPVAQPIVAQPIVAEPAQQVAALDEHVANVQLDVARQTAQQTASLLASMSSAAGAIEARVQVPQRIDATTQTSPVDSDGASLGLGSGLDSNPDPGYDRAHESKRSHVSASLAVESPLSLEGPRTPDEDEKSQARERETKRKADADHAIDNQAPTPERYRNLLQELEQLYARPGKPEQQLDYDLNYLHALSERYAEWTRRCNELIKKLGAGSSRGERLLKEKNRLQEAYQAGPWIEGKKIYESLMAAKAKGQKALFTKLEEYKQGYEKQGEHSHIKAIIAVIWYLSTQSEPCDEVTYQVDDCLFYFFSMAEQLEGGDRRRTSTHNPAERIEHHGIDIPASLRDKAGWLMPNNKYTVLFFVRDQGMAILKPEDHGAHDFEDRAGHAVGLANSYYRKLLTGNDKRGFRKEHVPEPALHALKNFLKAALRDDETPQASFGAVIVGPTIASMLGRVGEAAFNTAVNNTKSARIGFIASEVKLRGLKHIPVIVERVLKQYRANALCADYAFESDPKHAHVRDALRALKDYLNGFDNLDIRMGNEIIVRKAKPARRNSAPSLSL